SPRVACLARVYSSHRLLDSATRPPPTPTPSPYTTLFRSWFHYPSQGGEYTFVILCAILANFSRNATGSSTSASALKLISHHSSCAVSGTVACRVRYFSSSATTCWSALSGVSRR